MNFSILPPEVTSAQMYTGAGSSPLLAAAASWDGLGAELSSAAESFSSVTSGLPWQGAAAAAMAAVSAQYSQWLSAAAAHAGSAGMQANAVAGIFESAKAAITHPMAVTANRMQLVSLVRSNLLGFNAPAIAATEGAYESMWAQNVGALSGYHGAASAAVAQLTPWQQALQSLTPLGSAPSGSALGQLMANNKAAVANLQTFQQNQLANTQALTKTDLAAAGAALGSGQLGVAAQDVTDAGLINAGTALRVAARTGGFVPQLAGQDLNVLGGGGGGGAVMAPAPVLDSARVVAPPTTGSGSGLLGQLMTNNQGQVAAALRQNSALLANTQALTHSDLAAAGAALGSGDVGSAVRDVADAGLINAGTALEVGGRTAFFAPFVAGQDIDILGGGGGLLATQPVGPIFGMTTAAAVSPVHQLLQTLTPTGTNDSGLGQVMANNQSGLAHLESLNNYQLSSTQALTRSDLAAAGAALGSGDLGSAVQNVANAGLINAGSTLDVGARTAGFVPQAAGQDLNILGGGSTGLAKTFVAQIVTSPGGGVSTSGGGDGLLAQLLANNNADMDRLLNQNSFQLADTRALTHSDLAAAGAALRSGDVGTAVQDVANAGLINAGTTLDVGGRTVFLAPQLAGEDLDIAGGGADLISPPPVLVTF